MPDRDRDSVKLRELNMKRFTLAMTAVAALMAASGMAQAADCDVTIGLVMELTGPAGEYGRDRR